MLSFSSLVANKKVLNYLTPNVASGNGDRQTSPNSSSKENYGFFCEYRNKISEHIKYDKHILNSDITNTTKLIECLEEYRTLVWSLATVLSEGNYDISSNWIHHHLRNWQAKISENSDGFVQINSVEKEKTTFWLLAQKQNTKFPCFKQSDSVLELDNALSKSTTMERSSNDRQNVTAVCKIKKIRVLFGSKILEVDDIASMRSSSNDQNPESTSNQFVLNGRNCENSTLNESKNTPFPKEHGEYWFSWNGCRSKSLTFEYCCILQNLFVAKTSLALQMWENLNNGGNGGVFSNFLANPAQCFGSQLFPDDLLRMYDFVKTVPVFEGPTINPKTSSANGSNRVQIFSNIWKKSSDSPDFFNMVDNGTSTRSDSSANPCDSQSAFLEEVSQFENVANILTTISNTLAEAEICLLELEKYSNFVEFLDLETPNPLTELGFGKDRTDNSGQYNHQKFTHWETKCNILEDNVVVDFKETKQTKDGCLGLYEKLCKICNVKFTFAEERLEESKRFLITLNMSAFVDNFLLRTASVLKKMESEKKSNVEMFTESKKRWNFLRAMIWEYHLDCKASKRIGKRHLKNIFITNLKKYGTAGEFERFQQILNAKKKSKKKPQDVNGSLDCRSKSEFSVPSLEFMFEQLLENVTKSEQNE